MSIFQVSQDLLRLEKTNAKSFNSSSRDLEMIKMIDFSKSIIINYEMNNNEYSLISFNDVKSNMIVEHFCNKNYNFEILRNLLHAKLVISNGIILIFEFE